MPDLSVARVSARARARAHTYAPASACVCADGNDIHIERMYGRRARRGQIEIILLCLIAIEEPGDDAEPPADLRD